jgi:hypothetical protein
MPFGQLCANFDSRNFFCTWSRKAATSGVVTLTPLPSKKAAASFSVAMTPVSLAFLASFSADSIAFFSSADRPSQNRQRA